jgi:outer membrane protein OmpA-like peptidoglycan-associated protein
MFDPTSNTVIGRYKSDEWQGEYHLTGNADREYIVEVRSEGYSFDSYIVNYKDNAKSQLPQTIELFDTIQLAVSVYDSEIFRPLESKVIAVRVSDKAIFRSKKIGEGYYLFSLPLGSNYNIIATSNKFAENKFLQKLEGDVIFSRFERQLPLAPTKRDVTVKVVDAKTGAPVAANVTLANLSREEQLFVDGAEMSNGVAKVKLREGDIYDLIVGGARRYSFHNRTLDMSKSTDTEFVVELTPLEAGASVRLNDIRFATASSDIMIESYEELDRVVTLLAENPTLRIEIAAHTDNVGNAKYNMKLSENRALSVLNYLVDSGVDESRLIAKGYGLTKPLEANDSEENKAINRRVEFKILAEE